MAFHPPSDPQSPPVRRRWVGYLSGFDPRGPAHYHRLYAEEAAKQAAMSGYRIQVGPRRQAGPRVAWWDVHCEAGGQATDTRYEFLRWDDLVRTDWPRGAWPLLRAVLGGSWCMWRDGVMAFSLRAAWPVFLTLAVPGIALLGATVLSLLAWAFGACAAWHGRPLAGLLALLAGPALWLATWIWLDRRRQMTWLMRSVASLARQGRGASPALQQRLDELAAHLADVLRTGACDELLLVGHSSGAMQAMSVMARALARTGGPSAGSPQLALLTLGHCTPLLSIRPQAAAFRAELASLVAHAGLCWVDYTAPPDGCAFALFDPTARCAPDASAGQRPKLLNPRFAQLFDAARYQAMRRDKMRCHFQYLMAGERAGDYDYFLMTAGPQSLAQRHAGRASVTDFRRFRTFGGPAS